MNHGTCLTRSLPGNTTDDGTREWRCGRYNDTARKKRQKKQAEVVRATTHLGNGWTVVEDKTTRLETRKGRRCQGKTTGTGRLARLPENKAEFIKRKN